jgi:hypothetical protein
MRRLAIRSGYRLHFQKDRTGGARCDVARPVVEQGTESRGSARHG